MGSMCFLVQGVVVVDESIYSVLVQRMYPTKKIQAFQQWWYVLLSLLLLYFLRSLRVQWSNINLIKEKAKEKKKSCVSQIRRY
jgi:hypothetical protein